MPSLREKPSSGVQNSQNMLANDGSRNDRNDVRQVYPEENIPDAIPDEVEAQDEINELDLDADELVSAEKKESKIGKILSELSIKKIIIVVLLMMFIIPLFSFDLYRDPENVWDYLLVHQGNLLSQNSTSISTASILDLINQEINSFSESVIPDGNFIIQYTSPFKELPYLSNVDLTILRN